jgi:hypothetical protein
MASAFTATVGKANRGTATSCGRFLKRRKKLRSTILLEMTARRLWPNKTAAEVAARAGVSTRTAEYWLSHVHNMPLEAFFRLLNSDQGDAFFEVVTGGMAKEPYARFVRQMRDEIATELARSLIARREVRRG